MKLIDLFAGIGGFSLAAHALGWRTEAFVEKDSYCQKVLKKNFKGVPIYGDIREFSGEAFAGIDLITGGFPCQPFSLAGKQRGSSDERDLSSEMLRVIREARPRWIVAENVRGLLSNNGGVAFESICANLENEGYQVQPVVIGANCAFAEHIRERVWLIGRRAEDADVYTDSKRRELGEVRNEGEAQRPQGSDQLPRNIPRFSWFQTISRIHRKFNGVSRRLDGTRNRVLGNSLHPGVAYRILKSIQYSDYK